MKASFYLALQSCTIPVPSSRNNAISAIMVISLWYWAWIELASCMCITNQSRSGYLIYLARLDSAQRPWLDQYRKDLSW